MDEDCDWDVLGLRKGVEEREGGPLIKNLRAARAHDFWGGALRGRRDVLLEKDDWC